MQCPNRAWSGCTHSDHVFKRKGWLKKHVAACEIARKQTESEEKDLRPLVKQIVARMNELERQVALLKEDNRNLREMIRAPTIRGNYEVRGHAETPTHGFGEWDQDFFLKNLQTAEDFYQKRVGHSILSRNFKEFLCAVFYVANGETNVVRISPTVPKNRNGNPLQVDLNFRARRRTVTLEAAVKRLFEKPFLPSAEEIANTLERPVPLGMKKKLKYYLHYMNMSPNKKKRDFGSWEVKVELLLALADYEAPEKVKRNPKRQTRAERADKLFEYELQGEGRFWRYMDPETLVETYDELLADSPQYVTLLREYLEHEPDKLRAYREAGGLHTDRL